MHPKLDSQITFLGTKDLAKTHDFYNTLLGFPLVLDQGNCRIYQTVSKAYLGFCQRDTVEPPEGVILTLVTQDVDGWFESLQKQSVNIEKTPSYNPEYQIYHCFLRDPNGYLIEIQRFEDPRWN